MSDWDTNWYRHCKGCGKCTYASRSNSFISDFFQGKTCSRCGEYAGDWISCETSRTVFLGSWWKPWTWHQFQHQSKNRRNENPNSPDHDSFMDWYHG